MNNIWKRLTNFGASGIVTGTKKEKRARPYTMAFAAKLDAGKVVDVNCVEIINGDVRDFTGLPLSVTTLNVVHKNGKVTVIKR